MQPRSSALDSRYAPGHEGNHRGLPLPICHRRWRAALGPETPSPPVKRTTHITTGAAVALPVAVGLSPAAAAGAIFMGMAGAVVPDYADLRSDVRRLLRHRGVSHSVLFAAGAIGLVYLILNALSHVAD